MGSRPGANRRHKFNSPVSPKESFLFEEVDRNAKGTRLVVRSNSHETSHDLDVFVFRRQPESVGFVPLSESSLAIALPFSLFLSAEKALEPDKMSLFCAAMEGSIKLDARITILGINCTHERFTDGG